MIGPTVYVSEKDVPAGTMLTDVRNKQLEELFSVRNPSLHEGTKEYLTAKENFASSSALTSVFVYYPWRHTAVRMLPEAEYFELRTARNRNIILPDEQSMFRSARVAIAGLSVGSSVAYALVQSGGPQNINLADPDVIETTNLNRLRAGIVDLAQPKTEVTARMVWELDPFAELTLFPEGVTRENITRFAKADLIIDEMESLEFKVLLRQHAKQNHTPVVMATDNGNGIIIEIERFDLDPELPILRGILPEDPDELRDARERWLELATRIVGEEYIGERMRRSLAAVGKTIASVPQLGSSASLAGAAVAYTARCILTGSDISSGRYAYTLEDLFESPAKP